MTTPLFQKLVRTILFPAVLGLQLGASAQSPDSYLPLGEGNRWVLKSPSAKTPVTVEVLSRDGEGYRIRFDSPFGANDWTLVPRDGKFMLAKFGKDGQMMDLPAGQVYFDFTAPAKASWKMAAGQMSVVDKNAVVKSYRSGIKIKQGEDLVFTFAPNVGFVQIGDGKDAFVLDEASSRLPARTSGASGAGAARPAPANPGPVPSTRQADDNVPVAHVPGAAPSAPPPAANAKNSRSRRSVPRIHPNGPLLVGITVNTYANEPQSPDNLLRRWQQSLDTGVNFVVSNGKWDELEPKKGSYQLDALKFQVSEAEKHNLQVAYTLRLIDTVARTMPSELMSKKWTDREMEARALKLVEAIAPLFKDRVKWFMFGNEIDGYFGKHRDEIPAFAQLYDRVSKRMKELVPGIQVSSTMMFGGLGELQGAMSPLNDRFDFLAVTYYPIRADFTMKDPGIVTNDFSLMRNAAEGRGVVLQEIGYASSAVNGSSAEKQAAFVRNVFRELKANRDVFEAGSYFLLGDLSDPFVKNLSRFYGITDSKTFLAFLQTTGLFDLQGKAKPGWDVFQSEVRSLKP